MYKRMLMHTICNGSDDANTITGTSPLNFTTGSDHPIEGLIIYGDTCTYDENELHYVGESDEAGGCVLNIRVHSTNWMDGREMVRQMVLANSPCYGGEYDSEHFIYICKSDGTYPVTSAKYMRPGNDVFTLSAQVLVLEDRGETAFSSGIHFDHYTYSGSPAKVSSGTVGEQTLSGKSLSMGRTMGLVHKPVAEEFNLPIKYDSVKLLKTGTSTDDGYIGYTSSIEIGEPLRKIPCSYRDDICDELDAVNGTLTRRVYEMKIDESTTIGESEYSGSPCFYIQLPFTVRSCVAYCIRLVCYENSSEMLGGYASMFVAPTRNQIYFRVDDETTLEEAKEMLMGESILLPLGSEVTTTIDTTLDNLQPAGEVWVEVCSRANPELTLKYKK